MKMSKKFLALAVLPILLTGCNSGNGEENGKEETYTESVTYAEFHQKAIDVSTLERPETKQMTMKGYFDDVNVDETCGPSNVSVNALAFTLVVSFTLPTMQNVPNDANSTYYVGDTSKVVNPQYEFRYNKYGDIVYGKGSYNESTFDFSIAYKF